MSGRREHTIGESSADVAQRAFDLLDGNGGVELCDACRRTPLRCDSIRQAFYRLKRRGVVESIKTSGTRLFFVVRDAVRPVDRRGVWQRN